MKPDIRPKSRPRNITVTEVIDRALEALAKMDGHGNVSRLIHDMTRDRAKAVFGPQWQRRITDEKEAA